MSGSAKRRPASEESRRRILEATLEAIKERGYERTTISLVSARSGLPTGSVYWHFASKDALIASVIQDTYERWRDRQLPLRSDGSRGFGDLTSMLRSALDESDPLHGFWQVGLVLVLEQHAAGTLAQERFLAIRREITEMYTSALLSRSARDGRASDPAWAHRMTRLMLAAVDGALVAITAGETTDPEQLAADIVALLRRMAVQPPDQ